MDNFSHLFKFYFAVHNYSLTDIENLLSDPDSQCKWTSEDMSKQRVKNIIQLFFFPSIRTQSKEVLQPLLTLYFLCFCLLLLFFLVSMKDCYSHLTKLWAWLKAVRTTEFSKKLIVCKTQKLPNAPDITSLEDEKIRFQSEEKKILLLRIFFKTLTHIFKWKDWIF